jgi:hypothetical protein
MQGFFAVRKKHQVFYTNSPSPYLRDRKIVFYLLPCLYIQVKAVCRLQQVRRKVSEGNPAPPASVSTQETPVCAQYPGGHGRSKVGGCENRSVFCVEPTVRPTLSRRLDHTIMKTVTILPQIAVIVKILVASFFLYHGLSLRQFHNHPRCELFPVSF